MKIKQKDFIYYTIILSLSLIFKEQINEFVVCYMVEFFSSTNNSIEQIGFVIFYKDDITLYCFIILSVIFLFLYYTIIKYNYKISIILNFIICILFIYVFNRIITIESTNIKRFEITIFDLFVGFNILFLSFVKIRTLDCFVRNNNENTENKLIVNSIEKSNPIDYEELAKKTVSRIEKYRSKHAFIYTFLGKYGQGKTTLMNRIDHLLNEDAAIKRWYYPKKYMNEESAVEGLLNIFKEILSPYSSEIFDLIEGYSNALFQEKSSMLFDKINILKKINSFESQESIENINNAIRRTGKTIIIFIDDMDRLQKEEIDVVFKLMRNISDFCNTVFVVAYDYDYIVEKTGYSQYYLEKYSNLTYSLPIKEDYTIEAYIYQQLKGVLKNEDFEKIENFVKNPLIAPKDIEKESNTNNYDNISISKILKNHREVDAFLNSFMLYWYLTTKGNKEFYYQEFFVYKLLLFKYPWINKVIEESIKQFFSINGLNTLFEENEELRISELIIYQKLRKIKEEESKIINNDIKEGYNINNQYFDKLEKEEQESIDKIIEFLFDKNKGLEIEKKYSISKYIYYKMYSCDNSIGDLKISDFVIALNNFESGALKDFFDKVNEKYTNNKIIKEQMLTEYFQMLLNNTEINEDKVIAYLEMIYLLYIDNKEEMSTMNIDYEILQTAYLFLKTYQKQNINHRIIFFLIDKININEYYIVNNEMQNIVKNILNISNNISETFNNWFEEIIVNDYSIFTEVLYLELIRYNDDGQKSYSNKIGENNENITLNIFKDNDVEIESIENILFKTFTNILEKENKYELVVKLYNKFRFNKYKPKHIQFINYHTEFLKKFNENFINTLNKTNFFKYDKSHPTLFKSDRGFIQINFDEAFNNKINIYINCLDLSLFADKENFNTNNKIEQYKSQYDNYLSFLEVKLNQEKSNIELSNKINYIKEVVTLLKDNNNVTKEKFIEILSKYEKEIS
jgi:hypothetical protein